MKRACCRWLAKCFLFTACLFNTNRSSQFLHAVTEQRVNINDLNKISIVMQSTEISFPLVSNPIFVGMYSAGCIWKFLDIKTKPLTRTSCSHPPVRIRALVQTKQPQRRYRLWNQGTIHLCYFMVLCYKNDELNGKPNFSFLGERLTLHTVRNYYLRWWIFRGTIDL